MYWFKSFLCVEGQLHCFYFIEVISRDQYLNGYSLIAKVFWPLHKPYKTKQA